MKCAGSLAMEAGMPDTSSAFAEEGTLAHELAAQCLENKRDSITYVGSTLCYPDHGTLKSVVITGDMAEHVQTYVDAIRQYAAAPGAEMLVEQRLEFSQYVDVPDQFGTSDVVILVGDEIQIHDLKYGRGVKVEADNNAQMMLYALGALGEFSLTADFTRVRMVIHQPRLNHLSEWDCSVDDLLAFAAIAKERAFHAIAVLDEVPGAVVHHLTPGEDQCRFCKAKGSCPKLRDQVLSTVADDFVDVAEPIAPQIEHRITADFDNGILGNLMGSLDLIESWCKAVRAKAEAELFAGHEVPGYKLVEGRLGARAWSDAEEAEKLLKSFRLKEAEMYDFKLISPTTAEKVLKEASPKRWTKAQALISRADGKPSVAPITDKRPALVISPVVDDFADLTNDLV